MLIEDPQRLVDQQQGKNPALGVPVGRDHSSGNTVRGLPGGVTRTYAGRPGEGAAVRLEQLRYLDTALRLGSVRRAAIELGVAQPSVSAQIRRLEEDLGVVLITRGAQGVRPTDAAEAILPHLRAALRAEDAMRQEAGAITGLRAGRVRLGSISAASHAVLPVIVRRFRSEYPSIHFQVTERGSTVISDDVATGEFDLGIVSRFLRGGSDRPGLRYIDLAHGRIVLCLPPGHRLAQRRSVEAADLAGEAMVVFHRGYLLRAAFDALAAEHAIDAVYYTDSAETAQRMVAAGVGLSLASTLAPNSGMQSLDGVHLALLDEEWAETRMSVVLRSDEQPSPAVRAFLRILQQESHGLQDRLPDPF
ncbi:LysR family transcriptional regulator [Blastococcus saxobsidens]|uniref:LysR family transcriptional regulator n=1 Tax=Blastococcus saxobsidens TaxID=138336 RepID=UPI00140FB3D9|nr:LysR family transcriptional regulator [Blastococcus saxobsidens]